jgi:multidrug efflux pump subunit AcrB
MISWQHWSSGSHKEHLHKLERPPRFRDRERAISIYGNVAPGKSQSDALAFVEQLGKDVPASYRIVLGGSSVAFKE